MKKSAMLLISLISVSPIALADTQQNLCKKKPESSQEIFTCSKLRLEASDTNLNQRYKDLNIYIEKSYDNNPKLRDELKSNIKKSQLLWIKLRDANCEIEAFPIEPQAQAFETTKNNCSARETEERSEYLLNLKNHTL